MTKPNQKINVFFLQLQAKIVQDAGMDYNYCSYNKDISTGYGIGAFFCLLASQAIVMAASRCFCCGKALTPGGSRACALILFIVCWYVLLISSNSVGQFFVILIHIRGQVQLKKHWYSTYGGFLFVSTSFSVIIEITEVIGESYLGQRPLILRGLLILQGLS